MVRAHKQSPLSVTTLLLAAALAVTSCTVADDRADPGAATSLDPPSTTIEDYPDAQTRAYWRQAAAPRPVPRSALPPRHLDLELFPETLVDRSLIVSGGVFADAIPSIDEPQFEAVADVDWLDDDEAVLALEVDGLARAYPIQVMIWHEIVNDSIGGRPIAVTYCPLCNSGVAFDRRIEGEVLDFGTSGSLYQSALVMYDRQTESLWTHFDGYAVVGDLIGRRLELLPVATVSWHDFAAAHPNGQVLSRVGSRSRYGDNPYGFYDRREAPLSGYYRGEVDRRLDAMTRVVGLQIEGAEVAVSLDLLRKQDSVTLDIDGRRAVVWWTAGGISALDANRIDEGFDLGVTGAFWSDLTFVPAADPAAPGHFIDDESSSRWNVLGQAVEGAAADTALVPIPHVDTFWFAWSTYHPDTVLRR